MARQYHFIRMAALIVIKPKHISIHDDVIKWKHFRVTGLLCGELTGHRWIPRTKASDTELWPFLSFLPE